MAGMPIAQGRVVEPGRIGRAPGRASNQRASSRPRVAPEAPVQGQVQGQVPVVQSTVVRGAVVQGTVVGQPMAWEDRWGYPVQQVMLESSPQDVQSAQSGWLLYGLGWILCCCFGPVGPIFWLVVGCRFYCKPEEERKQLPQEGKVAQVSLWTALLTLFLNFVPPAAFNCFQFHVS